MEINKKNFKSIALDKLVKASWNYKEDNETQMTNLVNNMKRNNQVENLQVRELDTGFFEVINGNHRLDAMSTLEFKSAMCYNHGTISLPEAQRIAIETNETRFQNDGTKMSELIAEISKDFSMEELAQTLPFTPEEIEGHINLLNYSFDDINTDGEEGEFNPNAPDNLKTIMVKVPEETFNLWKQWKERMNDELGYDSETKAIEFALIEAMNTPNMSK